MRKKENDQNRQPKTDRKKGFGHLKWPAIILVILIILLIFYLDHLFREGNI